MYLTVLVTFVPVLSVQPNRVMSNWSRDKPGIASLLTWLSYSKVSKRSPYRLERTFESNSCNLQEHLHFFFIFRLIVPICNLTSVAMETI